MVANTNLEKMRCLKKEIRAMVGKGTWPCHITDTQEEAITLARIYFNPNSLLVANGKSVNYDSCLNDKRIDELKRRVIDAGLSLDGIVGVGSTALCVAGVREAKDFDFLALTNEYNVICDDVYSAHDSQLRYYPCPKDEMINNESFHFCYRGMKFISLGVFMKMKKKRHEFPKDFKDIIRLWLFETREKMLHKMVSWRWIV